MRLSSSGNEGWHHSVRLVKVRWFFRSQRLPQILQTIIHSFRGEEMFACVASSMSESVVSESVFFKAIHREPRARSPRGRVQPHIGHFGQTRIVIALMVALSRSACLAQYLRLRLTAGSMFAIPGETGDDPPFFFVSVLQMSGSGF